MAPLINKEINSFLGGVSEQPPETRLDSQVEESINSILDPASGAMKRPPLIHKALIAPSRAMREPKMHLIDRDENENYVVTVEAGVAGGAPTDLEVLDANTGSKYPVVQVSADDSVFGLDAYQLDTYEFGSTSNVKIGIDATWLLGNANFTANGGGFMPEEALVPGGLNVGTEIKITGTGITEFDYNPATNSPTFWVDTVDNSPVSFTLDNTIGLLPSDLLHSFGMGSLSARADGIAGSAAPPSYISDIATPDKSLRMLTIADSTFVVNRLQTVAMSGTPPAVPLDRAVISCSGGGVLNAASDKFAESVLAGYDADEPKALVGPRWLIEIGTATNNATANLPGTISNSEQSILQIKKTHDEINHTWQAQLTVSNLALYNFATFRAPYSIEWLELTPTQRTDSDGSTLDPGPNDTTKFRGHTGWKWEFTETTSGLDNPTAAGPDNFIVGEYDPAEVVAPADLVAQQFFPVTVPTRERIEFTVGGKTLNVMHNWNGPGDVSKLPSRCTDGFITKIVGDPDVEADEYYLKFSEKDSAWIESIGESTSKGNLPLDSALDPTTMPHTLKRRVATGVFADDHNSQWSTVRSAGDVYFTFGREKWANREVGDDVMAPEPSFVGQTLNDILLYKDRLVVLSRDSAVFSEVREPLNFWPTSIMSLVDSDPIDVQASTTTDGVSNFHSGVGTEAGLLLFTDNAQFLARSGFQEGFSSRSVHIDQISRYQSANIAKPTFVGSRVYWVTEQGAHSKVWEYVIASASGGGSFTGNATDITGHVPSYLPANIYKLTGNDNEAMLCFLSRDTPKNVFVYQYLFNGNNRLQSAWTKWEFEQDILSGDFIDSNLHLLIDRSDALGSKTSLEYLPPRRSDPSFPRTLTEGPPIPNQPVMLDQRAEYFNNGTNPSGASSIFTEVVLPYDWPSNLATAGCTFQIVVGGSGPLAGTVIPGDLGTIITGSLASSNSVFIPDPNGIYKNTTLYIGRKYSQDITFSRFIIKSTASSSRAVQPYTSGRTQIRTFSLKFSTAGPFTITVDNGGELYTYNYYDPWLIDGQVGPGVGTNDEFKVDVGGQNSETTIQVVNDTPFLTNFIGAIYEASWNTRSRRL